MRTTVEISNAVRAKLLSLAAKRGMKGFSAIVEDALEQYLRRDEAQAELLKKARAAKGSLDDAEVQHMRKTVSALRRKWR